MLKTDKETQHKPVCNQISIIIFFPKGFQGGLKGMIVNYDLNGLK